MSSYRCLLINLGSLEEHDMTADETEKLFLGNMCDLIEKSLNTKVSIYDSELSNTPALLDAINSRVDNGDSFAVVRCLIKNIDELHDLVQEAAPQHEHNKDVH